MSELEILKKLERKYSRWINRWGRGRFWNDTHFGLCYALSQIVEFNGFDYKLVYSRLYSEYINFGNTGDGTYWWERGLIKPRLQTIRAAIKTLKNEQKNI